MKRCNLMQRAVDYDTAQGKTLGFSLKIHNRMKCSR